VSSSLRRGALAATAIALSFGSLSACSAGSDAETLQVKPDNAATTVGDLKLQNIAIVTQSEPEATGPATVTGTIFNKGDEAETLESIILPGTNSQVKLNPAKGSGEIVVPAGGSVLLGGKDNAAAVITEGSEAVRAGDAQEVVFQFSEEGEVPIEAFVVRATHHYKDFGPTEGPDASATPTVGQDASGTPTAAASPAAEGAKGEAAGPSASASQDGEAHDAEAADH
jgi:hypothetical protein